MLKRMTKGDKIFIILNYTVLFVNVNENLSQVLTNI